MHACPQQPHRWLIFALLVAPSAWSMAALGQSAPEHGIVVWVANGSGEFYDRLTSAKLAPQATTTSTLELGQRRS